MEKLASIVSVGGWNPKLFTPQWVAENVFCLPPGQKLDVQIDPKQMTLSFTSGQIIFSPTERGLEFRTQDLSSENLAELDKIHKHINDILPFTPVMAFGFNIHLIMSQEEYLATRIFGIVPQPSLDQFKTSSHVFFTSEESMSKSVNVIFRKDEKTEIATNYQFSKIDNLPIDGNVFELMKKEINVLVGYGIDY